MADKRGMTSGRTGHAIGRRAARGMMRITALGLALALALSSAATAAPSGSAAPDGVGPGLGGGLTEPMNDCTQRCFDKYLQNIGSCVSQFCGQFLFITWCDDDQMTQCKVNAQVVFDSCIAECNTVGGE